MKKTGKPRKTKSKRAKPQNVSQTQPMDRRRFMQLARNGAIAAVALGGVGVFGTRSVMAKIAEHDLTRVGQGVPTVVQVHDPNCNLCRTLQKEARKAVASFDGDDLLFLVANLKTTDGEQFAARYRVPHVTLLLFDGDGKLVETLQGVRQRDELRGRFATLLANHGAPRAGS